MGFFDDLGKNLAAFNPTIMLQGASAGLAGGRGLSDILGTKDNFQAQNAPIVNPITNEQLQAGIAGGQGAVTAQQQLAQQLIGGNFAADQAALNDALRNQMMGIGPNPAQAALANATANNVANQAALMAGQRGAGANAGMIARQAGQVGGNIQQQAVGQSALMQAQQQLAAQQAMQQQGQQALQAQGQATNAALNQQGQMLGAQGQYNQALVSDSAATQGLNQAVSGANAQRNAGLIGGVLGGIGSLVGLGKAHGGQIPSEYELFKNHYYGGGQVNAMVSPGEGYVKPQAAQAVAQGDKDINSVMQEIPGKAKVKGDSPANDTVPKKLDAGGVVIPRTIMDKGEKAAVDFLKDALRKGPENSKKEMSDFQSALKRAISSRGK